MALNVIITGASGMVGKGVLLYCLESSHISKVLVVGRTSIGLQHDKLKEIILPDLFDLSKMSDELRGYDACYFCLGVSSAGMSESEYSKITNDLTLSFASALKAVSPQAVFCYVSGEGTDSSEKGKVMWARVKGKTENALLNMGFAGAYMFRPGFIKALRGAQSKTKLYAFLYLVFKPVFPLIMLSNKIATDTDRIAKAMITVTLHKNEKKVLNTFDINKIATESLLNNFEKL